jgi:hypothetical protein
MTRHLCCLALVAAVLAGAPTARGQEKYEIKIARAKQGDTELVEKTEVETATFKVVDKDGNAVKEPGPTTKETRLVYRETFVEKPAGAHRATKVKRTYQKAEVVADDKVTPLVYHGKTVLIEKKGDKYHFQIEGGAELTGEDAELLEKEFGKKDSGVDIEKVMLPGKAVAVGEGWVVDAAAVAKDWADPKRPTLDAAKVKVTGKLLKAYKKDGRQFGLLQYELVLPVKSFPDKDGKPIEAEPGAKFVATITGDVCIDGTLARADSKVRVDVNATLAVPDNPQFRYVITGRIDITEHRKEAPK